MSGFRPATALADIAGLAAALAGKAATVHTHALADVTGLVSALAGKAASVHTHAQADITGLVGALTSKADLVAGLIPTSQLPALAITDTFAVASQSAMLALTAERGDVAIRSDTSATYILAAEPASTLANWRLLPTGAAVLSVQGQTGVIVLSASDVGALAATATAGGALTGNYPNPSIGSGVVTAAMIATALKGGASAGTEALRALGTTSTTAAAGNDPRFSGVTVSSDKTAAYTLATSDTLVPINSSSAVAVTVPANATTAIPVGQSTTILRRGAGATTIVPAAGVTLEPAGTATISAQYRAATATKIATDTWSIVGAI